MFIEIDGLKYTLDEAEAIDWNEWDSDQVYIDAPNEWDLPVRLIIAKAQAAGIEVQ